jgi:hypothetical protein
MTSPESRDRGADADLVNEIAALMRECLEKVRRQDPPETWQGVYARIEELQADLDELAPGVGCTYCGAARQTTGVHIFELRAPDSRWNLCDRCWHLMEIGLDALRPGVDLMEYLTRDFGVTDVMVRGYVRLGGALLERKRLA